MPKIAVTTPVYSDPKFDFTFCLFRAIRRAERELGYEVDWVPSRATGIAAQRNLLAEVTVRDGFTHNVWIDSDQTFPEDAIVRLMRHGKKVVGANYLKREAEPKPTAHRVRNGSVEPVWTSSEAARDRPLEQVHTLGLGLCLVDVSVYRGLPQPLFHSDREDSWFFGNLYKAGVPVYVDHILSLDVGHIAETALRFPR